VLKIDPPRFNNAAEAHGEARTRALARDKSGLCDSSVTRAAARISSSARSEEIFSAGRPQRQRNKWRMLARFDPAPSPRSIVLARYSILVRFNASTRGRVGVHELDGPLALRQIELWIACLRSRVPNAALPPSDLVRLRAEWRSASEIRVVSTEQLREALRSLASDRMREELAD
jgi:hypothetical protein